MATPQIYYKDGDSWKSALLNSYPVGAIYASTSSTSPSSIFGGGWAKITGAVLRGNDQAGVYSDSDTHILSVNEMPKHKHNFQHNAEDGPITETVVVADRSAITGGGSSFWTTGGTIFKTAITFTGGGQAHTNKQRAFNVYMWRRTS